MVHTGYNPALVVLSVVIAVFASYAALDLGARMRRPDTSPGQEGASHAPRRIMLKGKCTGECPVPPDSLERIVRAQPEALARLLDGMPEEMRARLAVWLHDHGHDVGIRVAATCEGTVLRQIRG